MNSSSSCSSSSGNSCSSSCASGGGGGGGDGGDGGGDGGGGGGDGGDGGDGGGDGVGDGGGGSGIGDCGGGGGGGGGSLAVIFVEHYICLYSPTIFTARTFQPEFLSRVPADWAALLIYDTYKDITLTVTSTRALGPTQSRNYLVAIGFRISTQVESQSNFFLVKSQISEYKYW